MSLLFITLTTVNNTGPRPVRTGTLPATAARILELLQDGASAMEVQQLADVVELHPNTVREQLQELVSRGLVRKSPRPAAGRGRPAWIYAADKDRREPDSRVREHSALAGVLAARISATSEDPPAEGRAAGEAWGAALATGREVNPRTQVVDVLEDMDFSPAPNRDRSRILLRTCPLLDVARQYPEVVCAVHEGLVAGLLQELDDPHEVRLQPFGAPDGCVLRLRRSPANP